ncbi:MAG: patatin-like phospholipase family protein [Dehalococcoidia bacterium]|nr:patatin-like phospholipase family protein [Dehalococcoidia bacterium]
MITPGAAAMNDDESRAHHRRAALVLGGGGTFGIVQAAYIHAVLQAGYRPSIVVGTSVGSLNGAWVALHPDDADGLLDVWLGLDRLNLLRLNPFYLLRRLIRHPVSICENRIVPELIARHLGNRRFTDTAVPLAVVATNLSRGTKHVFRSGPLGEAILASTAIPGVFPPVEIEGELYVDGGIAASVDLATAVTMGATEILAIDLTPPAGPARPRTALGVLRQSFGIVAHASTDAMEACLKDRLPVCVLRPDLTRHSPWRIDDSAGAIAHNLRLAHKEVADVLGPDGTLLPDAQPRRGSRGAVELRPTGWPVPRRLFGLGRTSRPA